MHIYNKRTVVVYLSNLSKVPGKWRISYVKDKDKSSKKDWTD